MSSSRDLILRKLRAVEKPFSDVPPIPADQRRHVVTLADTTLPSLQARFVKEAEALGCRVYCVSSSEAFHLMRKLIGIDRAILSWSFEHIPLIGLEDALNGEGISTAAPTDGRVRVGITGVDAALAATGSLVLSSGDGKPRSTSLLPDLHIAVMTPAQIVPDIETWLARCDREDFRAPANYVLITGPSKTADIAQELIKGAHGPREVHILLVE
jgi:L-lactate dehydrogenase complex protein LldG